MCVLVYLEFLRLQSCDEVTYYHPVTYHLLWRAKGR